MRILPPTTQILRKLLSLALLFSPLAISAQQQEFKAAMPDLDGYLSRAEAKEDLDSLAYHLRIDHPYPLINTDSNTFWKEFQAGYQKILSKDKIKRRDFGLQAQRMLAKMQDGHSNFFLSEQDYIRLASNGVEYPGLTFYEKDKVFIVLEFDGEDELCQLLKINDMSTKEIVDGIVNTYAFEYKDRDINAGYGQDLIFPYYEIIHGQQNEYKLTIKRPKQKRPIVINRGLKPAEHFLDDYVSPHRKLLFQGNPVDPHSGYKEYFGDGIAYFNPEFRTVEQPGCDYKAEWHNYQIRKVDSFFRKLKKKKNVQRLIIDLRQNPGGQIGTAMYMAQHVIEQPVRNLRSYASDPGLLEDEKLPSSLYKKARRNAWHGELLVLTDHGTFSSAAIAAAIIQEAGVGKIMGKKPMSGINSNGDTYNYLLKNSSYFIGIANFLSRMTTMDNKYDITVDYPVDYIIEDAFNGKDKVFEKAKSVDLKPI